MINDEWRVTSGGQLEHMLGSLRDLLKESDHDREARSLTNQEPQASLSQEKLASEVDSKDPTPHTMDAFKSQVGSCWDKNIFPHLPVNCIEQINWEY